MSEQGYNGWTNWDTWNVNLILSNEEELYRDMTAWGKNFLRRHVKGTFDIDQAAKAVRLYLLPLAIQQDKAYTRGKSEIDRKAVNCQEIAQSLLDSAIEEDAYQKTQA